MEQNRTSKYKRLKRVIIGLVVVYISLTIAAYVVAPMLLFQPPSAHAQRLPGEFYIKNQSHTVSAIYLSKQTNRYTLLFSHGNGDDLNKLQPLMQALYQHGYNVLAYDYDGYGRSLGRPSEKNCYADARMVYDYLTQTKHVSSDDIVLMGHSMGTGVTTYLASQVPVAGVILMSPMLSIYQVITHFPLFYPDLFSNERYIKKIHVPILIMHGTKDRVIPFNQGEKIYQMANQPKTFKAVAGAGHNNIAMVLGDRYFQILHQFTDQLTA